MNDESLIVFKKNLFESLCVIGTFRLVFLSVITLSIYPAYYIKKQTEKINYYLDERLKIPLWLVFLIFFLAYFLAVIFLAEKFNTEVVLYPFLKKLLEFSLWLSFVSWAYIFTNRLHALFKTKNDSGEWFTGILIFVFNIYYLNYKICSINEVIR
jgi:hypothetical protein